MLSARSGFVFVCLLVVGVESYWYQYLGSGPYFNKNWKQHRRSLSCAESEESCRRSSECCDTKDVCVRDRQQEGGICRNIENAKLNPEALKPIGTQCSDSAECGVGLCCRGVFLFRFGKVNRCQRSDGPFMCIASESFEY
uniref:WAP domain-containing protein n=1 Tax=Magallana gigas TaxID=29159 RepID=A0A8W8NAL9_MAGGI